MSEDVKKPLRVKTNAKGHGYKYTDIAGVNLYLEEMGESYYQYTESFDGKDYIMTVKIDAEGKESKPLRGCQIVEGKILPTGNVVQQLGAALTYARRYSLYMAYGLASEDDDAACLNEPPQPKQYQQKPPVQQRQSTPQAQPKQTAQQQKSGAVEIEHPTAQDIQNLASEVANKVDPDYRNKVKAVFESQPDGWQKTALESNNAKSFNDFDEKTVDKFGNIFKNYGKL